MNNIQKKRIKRIKEAGDAARRDKIEKEKKERKIRGTLNDRYKKSFTNDFIKKFKIDHSNTGDIVVNSLGRCGSTLITRICNQLGEKPMNPVQEKRRKRMDDAGKEAEKDNIEKEKKERKKRGPLNDRYKKSFTNDFIEELKTDYSTTGDIAVNSLGRCGSSLIARISSQLGKGFSLGVGNQGGKGNKQILVIRNWNDVLVTYWKTQMSQDKRYNEISSSKPTDEELDLIVTRLERIQKNLKDKYTPETLVLDYEKFYNNYDYIYDNLEIFLDIHIDKEKRKKITSKVSREATKKIQKHYETFDRMSDEHVHGDHISNDDGLPGSWKKYLDFDLTK